MKLHVLAPITVTLMTLATAMITGCGPGMSSHGASAPNEKMLAALRDMDEMQRGMRMTSGQDTPRLLREARDGAMYGHADRA